MSRLPCLPVFLLIGLFAVACRAPVTVPTPASAATVPSAPVVAPPTPTLAQPAAPVVQSLPTVEATAIATPLATPTTDIAAATATTAPTPLPTACATPGRIEHGTFESAVAGEPMRYRIYLPPCHSLDGHVYPTLYMLGGNIHDDAIWDALGLDEAAEAAIGDGRVPPLLIVMPDNGRLANTTTSGPQSYEGFFINELVHHIESNYCAWGDADGRAVGGLSRGGYWSLMMAFRRPDLFRSVAAHSPALIDSHAGPAEDPVVTGVINDLGDLRIAIDIGERDPYLIEAQPLHDALAADGVAHEWWVNEGTHDEAYWRAHLNDYLAWYSDGWRVERASLPTCASTS